MGATTGFLDYARCVAPYRPIARRLSDFCDIATTLDDSRLTEQAARCMDCGIPFCHALGCPLANIIPEWNDAVYRGNWNEALQRLELTNNLPEITGRVCPAPCEAACTLSINSSPVTIRQLELAIIEHGFAQGLVRAQPPVHETGHHVAVIGSGPAGISAAQQLRRAGHQVTVIEKADALGGIMRYGIPDFKLEKSILDRRITIMQDEGILFETGIECGVDVSLRYLQNKFDAMLITIGASANRDLEIPGRNLDGVCLAMQYLTQANCRVAGTLSDDHALTAKGKRVVVIGGGDTGSDCVGTALRQGARSVHQLEILPEPPLWEHPWNPQWPEWPNILRTSSSHEEGCERVWGVITTELQAKGDAVCAVHGARAQWSMHEGTPTTCTPQPGSTFLCEADLVLLALGFTGVNAPGLSDILCMTDTHTIAVDAQYATNIPGIFAAGDAVTGPSLIVRAIAHARQAADSINRSLTRR